VRGANLAIVTLAGGVAINEFVFKNPKYVGDASTGGAQIRTQGWAAGTSASSWAPRHRASSSVVSSSGRALGVPRGHEPATQFYRATHARCSINVGRVKLQVFAISSFIAGVGGCLIAYRLGSVSAHPMTGLDGEDPAIDVARRWR
jgi:branched-chain amino acid transport system permease protein